MRHITIFIIGIIVVFILVILALYLMTLPKEDVPEEEYVSEIIDGDTFKMSTGEIVRLICVDAPETEQPGYKETKEFLEHLVLFKSVRLEKDITNKDEYDRLLRYVYVNISDTEIFVNKEIVRLDYGKLFPYPPDTKRCGEISGS